MYCYSYALKMAMINHDVTVIHGTVTMPLSKPPEIIKHAWIEYNQLVQDYQTMETPCGGIFSHKGYPIEIFNELFQPKRLKVYTTQQARNLFKKYKHCGPWPE